MVRTRLITLVCVSALWLGCGGKSPGPGPTPTADPPSISCPADVTLSNVATPNQPVTFNAPSVSGGTAPVNVTCSQTSGAAFPLGTTAVSCTASDAASRSASCGFNVTLKGFTIGATKYLTLGDSVTEGQNGQTLGTVMLVDVPNAYPTRLQSLFDASFPGQGISVVNRGVGGEPIETGAARLSDVMAADRPDAVLLIDGYNNLLRDCPANPGPTPACFDAIEFVAGKLRECVRTAKRAPNAAKFVFVATLTPPGPFVRGPGFTSDRRIAATAITQLNSRIRSQIPNEGATIVDIYPLFLGHEAEYTSPDGLHLFPAGNQVVAEAFFAAIKNVVPQTPALAPGSR